MCVCICVFFSLEKQRQIHEEKNCYKTLLLIVVLTRKQQTESLPRQNKRENNRTVAMFLNRFVYTIDENRRARSQALDSTLMNSTQMDNGESRLDDASNAFCFQI